MSNILGIGDPHEPCCRKYYLDFCKDVQIEHNCDTVVFLGDIVDSSAISFHAHNPEAPGPKDEYKLAFAAIQKWYKAFPNATVCIGNHDKRVIKLAESVNIPKMFLRDFNDVWKTPGWNWVTHVIIDDVYYCHGHKKGAGKTPAWNLSIKMGLSVVMGHSHTRGGVNWSVNPLRRWFGMDTGCGIDDEAYAFAYAEEQVTRSVLSLGVVLDGTPQHIMMPISKGEKYYNDKGEQK